MNKDAKRKSRSGWDFACGRDPGAEEAAGFRRSGSTEVDYLRISVTDRCNLRCTYCMPAKGIETVSQYEVLTFEEIHRIVRIFSSLGITRIRLTGGEPLIRKGLIGLVEVLAGTEGIEEVSLTTNGTLLAGYAQRLKTAGLTRINISLDTLEEGRFREITRGGSLASVLEGIEKAKEAGFDNIKLNTVVMKGVNDDEVFDFADFALSQGLTQRFIEFMKVTPLWDEDLLIPIEQVINMFQQRYGLTAATAAGSGPASYYKTERGGVLGFIKTDDYNCKRCSRLRLTATGKLKICLYEDSGLSLAGFLRDGVSDAEIKNVIQKRLCMKESVDHSNWESGNVYMSSVGG